MSYELDVLFSKFNIFVLASKNFWLVHVGKSDCYLLPAIIIMFEENLEAEI